MSYEFRDRRWTVYLENIRGLPLPSDTQIHAFAKHFSQARSWFKKLPLVSPGEAFVFWLDRNAGCAESVNAAGVRQRVAGDADYAYHHRFGYLTGGRLPGAECCPDGGASPALQNQMPMALSAAEASMPDLPYAVREWTCVRLTAAVHPNSRSRLCSYIGRLQALAPSLPPNADLGLIARERLLALPKCPPDADVNALIGPEQERQQAQIVEALFGLRQLIEDARREVRHSAPAGIAQEVSAAPPAELMLRLVGDAPDFHLVPVILSVCGAGTFGAASALGARIQRPGTPDRLLTVQWEDGACIVEHANPEQEIEIGNKSLPSGIRRRLQDGALIYFKTLDLLYEARINPVRQRMPGDIWDPGPTPD